MTLPSLDALCEAGVLTPLDRHFALAMSRLGAESDPRVALAAALASRQVGAGHVCLDLARLVARPDVVMEPAEELEIALPSLDEWLDALRRSRLVAGASESAVAPLVLDARGRLYLRRYFEHEARLAEAILARAEPVHTPIDGALLDEGIARLFGVARPAPGPATAKGQLDLFAAPPPSASSAQAMTDPQARAGRTAVERAFCVVSGGPGTGKTSTVVRILALLVEQALGAGAAPPRIALLAPTGKAAARLTESIREARTGLACSDAVREVLELEAKTIHRALRALPGRTHAFRHDRERPLGADVVVVDEASMVDLALMARLFDAVPGGARVILLGDKDQLASVEAGAVLGDICGVGAKVGRVSARGQLADCLVELTQSWRYVAESGIGVLARAVNAGDADGALAVLRDGASGDVRLVEREPGRALWPELEDDLLRGLSEAFESRDAASRLRALGRFRVLCAHRHGPRGLVDVNERVSALFAARGLFARTGTHYDGLPLLVTANDYAARLFNGDVGVVLEREDGRLRACFLDASDEVREVALSRLPPHEPLYATSVHKSQGSELDEVAVVLPDEASPLTTRELLYTAVTRARKRVTIYAPAEVVRHAVATRVERASGLRDRLWKT